MADTIRIMPEKAFGLLILRDDNVAHETDIPLWLIDRPDVLKALLVLAGRGGSRGDDLAPIDYCDLVIDTAAGSVKREEAADA